MKSQLKSGNALKKSFLAFTLLALSLFSCKSENNCQENLLASLNAKDKGQFNDAIEYINRALKDDSSRSFAYLLRGQIQAILKKDSLAIPDYYRALTLDSANVSAYFYLGISFSNLNLQDSAIANFDKALSLKTKDGFVVDLINNENIPLDKQTDISLSQIHFYRAISFLFLNRLDEAQKSFLFTKGNGYEVGWSEYIWGRFILKKVILKWHAYFFKKQYPMVARKQILF